MHGLILAGGLGSRLAADGVPEPKPLMRVGGRPQLLRLCETLEALGCETVTCMVREGVPTSALGDARGRRVVSCATPSSLHTLALGLAAVPEGPVFCTMVDTVMPWDSWRAVWTASAAALAGEALAVLAVAPPPERDPDALLVRVDQAGWITAIGAGGSSLATAGVYGLSPAVRPLAVRAVGRGVQRMRGFLADLAGGPSRLRAIPVARALDLDRRADLDEANAWLPTVAP